MTRWEKAINALEYAISSVFLLDRWRIHSRRPGKPGEVIQSMSPEEREALSNLKSEDLEKLNVPEAAYYCNDFYQERGLNDKIKADKLAFDKKILK